MYQGDHASYHEKRASLFVLLQSKPERARAIMQSDEWV